MDNEKKEDYMGMVSWHRNIGAPRTLFGTEIQSNPITLTIKRATECRELSRNWYHSDKQLVEIEMSPIQWAEFLTNGNTEKLRTLLSLLLMKINLWVKDRWKKFCIRLIMQDIRLWPMRNM